MNDSAARIYTFGPFRLEPAQRRLLRDGQPVELPPKAFDAMVLLVDRAGRLVAKDEFHAELWPRVVVSEANLNKTIWQVRRALGDERGQGAYIETVSKQGYRFTAPLGIEAAQDPARSAVALTPLPVQGTSPAGAVAQPQASGASAIDPRPKRVVWVASACAAVLLIGALIAWWSQRLSTSTTTIVAAKSHALAVPPPLNLHPQADTAWLATALGELATSQFAGLQNVHIVPPEALRDFGFSPISEARAASTPMPSLAGADWILSCTYLVLAPEGLPPEIRIDLALVDATSGKPLAQASRNGRETDLFELVSGAGSELRAKLGLFAARDRAYDQSDSIVPTDPRAAAAYANGLSALRAFDAARAVAQLKEATALAADFAPAHAKLAEAWSLLGYDARAREEAATAQRLAGKLPREQQLHYAALAAERASAWPEAIRNYDALATFVPDNTEYAQLLAAAQIRSGDPAKAQTTLDRLQRAVPAAQDDPRVLILRARAFFGASNYTRGLEAATQARTIAERVHAPLLAAEAALQQGWCLFNLGRLDDARSADAFARDGFRASGNAIRASAAMQQLIELGSDDDAAWAASGPAIAELLAQARSAGYKRGEAQALALQCQVSWVLGDLEHWRIANESLLALTEELGDPVAEAHARVMFATLLAEAGDTAQAESAYRQAEAQFRSANPDYLAWALTLHADLARLRADFDAADALLNDAERAAAPGGSPRHLSEVHFYRGLVAFDRQASQQAETEFAMAQTAFEQTENRNQALELAGIRAQLALARGDATFARAALASGRKSADDKTDPAERAAFAARESGVLLDLDDTAAAKAALAEAEALLAHTTSRLMRLQTQLRLAADHWVLGEPAAARATWREIRDEAERRKLDLLRIEATIGLACDRADALKPAVAEANQRGFLRAVTWARAHCVAI